MGFLKNLFGGGGGGNNASKDDGIYYYVQPRGCEEIVRVRIDPRNELSRDKDGYFVRKTVIGHYRCFNPAELTVYLDGNKKVKNEEIASGTIMDEAAYDQWQIELEQRRRRTREHNQQVEAERLAAEQAETASSADEDTPA